MAIFIYINIYGIYYCIKRYTVPVYTVVLMCSVPYSNTSESEAMITILTLALAMAPTMATFQSDDSLLVTLPTGQGRVRGMLAGTVRQFLGLPYAAPPLGAARWRPPSPPTPFLRTLNVTEQRPLCMHPAVVDGVLPAGGDEDCLYLNVFAPQSITSNRPVIVYFPGGGYMTSGRYNCTNLVAETGMVYVVVQYRLGPFGFLAAPALNYPSEPDVTARLGILDQQQALRWVHKNIRAFGGDPKRTSIWGQSAGGGSVILHMTMRGSWPFFSSVVAESPYLQPVGDNDTSSNDGALRWRKAVAQGRKLIDVVGCGKHEDNKSLARCMREVPADRINSALKVSQGLIFATPNANWYPVFANTSHFPMARFLDGFIRPNTPMIVGNNKNESNMLAELFDPEMVIPASQGELEHAIAKLWGARKADVLTVYNASADGSHRQAFFAAVSDSVFNCPLRRIIAAHGQRHGTVNSGGGIFQYIFNGCEAPTMGATHGAELPLVFAWRQRLTQPVRAISKEMVKLWAHFQRDGIPGDAWSAVNFSGGGWSANVMMIMRNGSFVMQKDSGKMERCAVWWNN